MKPILRLNFDLEAPGLLKQKGDSPPADRVHCGVLINQDNLQERYRYGPDEVPEMLSKLDEATTLIGQNIIGYDLPLLKKLYGWEPKPDVEILDTLVLSRLSNPNRVLHKDCPKKVWDEHNQKWKKIGPHSLMNLGYIAGCLKGEFGQSAGWEHFSPEMLEYCEQDVVVCIKVFERLLKELRGVPQIEQYKGLALEMSVAAIIQRQMTNGWLIDVARLRILDAELVAKTEMLEDEVHKTFKPLPKYIKNIQPKTKKDGTLSSVGLKFMDSWDNVIPTPDYDVQSVYNPNTGKTTSIHHYKSGEFSKIDWPEFNLGSRQMIVEQLVLRGFTPTKFTEVTAKGGGGAPVVDDDVLNSIAHMFPEAALLADYFMVFKKQGMVNGWLEALEDDNRIYGYVNTLGCITNRMSHSKPNLAQVPKTVCDAEDHPIFGFDGNYGADCRRLFIAKPGYKVVTADASGLELRCLAHYMNDQNYTDLILNGDIHTFNQKAAGLATRGQAKTFIYAYLYGAGDAKIGSIVLPNGTEAEQKKAGKRLKKQFLKAIPSLKALKEGVEKAAKRGWLKGIDGRRIWVRAAYAALNTLLQSCGAVIMKAWLVLVQDEIDLRGLRAEPIGNVHDEGTWEVHEDDVDDVKEILEAMMIKAGEALEMKCPIAGEAMSGDSWVETH